MAPREATNPFADQYLTVEFDATAMMMPHDTGAPPPMPMPPQMPPAMPMPMQQQQQQQQMPMPALNMPVQMQQMNNPDMPMPIPIMDMDLEMEEQQEDTDTDAVVEDPTATPAPIPIQSLNNQTPPEVSDSDGSGSGSGSNSNSNSNSNNSTGAQAQAPTPPTEVLVNAATEAAPAAVAVTPSPQRTRQRRPQVYNHANAPPPLALNLGTNPSMNSNGSASASASNASVDVDVEIGDMDPLAVDMSDAAEEAQWNKINDFLVDAALASADGNHPNLPQAQQSNGSSGSGSGLGSGSGSLRRRPDMATPLRYHGLRRNSTIESVNAIGSNGSGHSSTHNGVTLPPHPHRNRRRHYSGSIASVLDQDSMSSDEEDITAGAGGLGHHGIGLELGLSGIVPDGVPDLDMTHDSSVGSSHVESQGGGDLHHHFSSSAPSTPTPHNNNNHHHHHHHYDHSNLLVGDDVDNDSPAHTDTSSPTVQPNAFRRLSRFVPDSLFSNVVANDDTSNSNSSGAAASASSTMAQAQAQGTGTLTMPPSPHRFVSNSSATSGTTSASGSGRSIHWNQAFDNQSSAGNTAYAYDSSSAGSLLGHSPPASPTVSPPEPTSTPEPTSSSGRRSSQQINLSFGPNTTVSDLKYFAERGCIVPLLRALDSPRLKTLGTRMLADYAKMPHRRVAVASNKRILEFCCRTMLELPGVDGTDANTTESMGTEWPAREYAVETIRSLTATEDSDAYLMGCSCMLKALAVVARGGPFAHPDAVAGDANGNGGDGIASGSSTFQMTSNRGLVSGKARLHACIAIMNLSCGKANKIEIASIPAVLDAMRDVMMATSDHFSPATSSPVPNGSSSNATPKSVSTEARLKAATCIKNLSNADANDGALLAAKGLVNALAQVAVETCSGEKGATNCTTNACLALMNLSISKDNKHKVFKTKGIMEALMTVLRKTSPFHGHRANNEARIKACSALSNLAIGYSNKIPMFNYPGFVDCILQVIQTDSGEARTKACSILWSFAAEMKNQVPVVERGDILPTLVRVAEEDHSTEARFKCVAALTLLAESLENAMPLLDSGALHPLMDILHDAGADPTQWKGQTASWCVGFLMNMAQSDDAAPYLREAGVVELLAPLLTLDHYQSLKAAMAVTFVCRYDEDDETYDLLRKTENVIPKIIDLLHNTLGGKGGKGYKYGVFTLRSSVGCISSLASGPEFMKERIATKAVFESLLRVVTDFCVNRGTDGAIVGGGRDDTHSSTLAVKALHSLTEYLIPIPGSSSLPFGPSMDERLMLAMKSFGNSTHPELKESTKQLAADAYHRIHRSLDLTSCHEDSDSTSVGEEYTRSTPTTNLIENSIVASLVQGCCIGPSLHGLEGGFFPSMVRSPSQAEEAVARANASAHATATANANANISATAADIVSTGSNESQSSSTSSNSSSDAIRTFLLLDERTGRHFVVPTDPSGGRAFNDGRAWCYRRGRFCRSGEAPDPNFVWTDDMQASYTAALAALRAQRSSSSTSQSSSTNSNHITTSERQLTTANVNVNVNAISGSPAAVQVNNFYQGQQ